MAFSRIVSSSPQWIKRKAWKCDSKATQVKSMYYHYSPESIAQIWSLNVLFIVFSKHHFNLLCDLLSILYSELFKSTTATAILFDEAISMAVRSIHITMFIVLFICFWSRGCFNAECLECLFQQAKVECAWRWEHHHVVCVYIGIDAMHYELTPIYKEKSASVQWDPAWCAWSSYRI